MITNFFDKFKTNQQKEDDKKKLQQKQDKNLDQTTSITSITPWIEKYRPKGLDDVVYQTAVINALKNCKQTGKLQHLLFYGPPGTGKTSTILAFARDIFGEDYKMRILELNASDERGIQVVREKVKKFSQKQITKLANKNVPNYQIVILDEADSMTQDAQGALRRVIEDYSATTRFCFICNYVSKIIDPIASRCAKYRFNPLKKSDQIERLNLISKTENIKIEPAIIEYLVDVCEGDLRRSINLFQSISQLGDKLMKKDIVDDVCGIISKSVIQNIFEVARSQNVENITKETRRFLSEGYDVMQFLTQLSEYIISLSDITSMDKSKISKYIMECTKNLLESGTPFVNLLNLLIKIRNIFAI